MTFNEIMNSPLLYALVGAGIVYILIFCVITMRKAYRHGLEIGLTKDKLKTAITSSAIYSVSVFRMHNPHLFILVCLYSFYFCLFISSLFASACFTSARSPVPVSLFLVYHILSGFLTVSPAAIAVSMTTCLIPVLPRICSTSISAAQTDILPL